MWVTATQKVAHSDFCCFIAASWSYTVRGKLALSDLHEAAMKQQEAPHIKGDQKLQSRIIDEAAVKQQFFSTAASSLLHANPRVQVFPLPVYVLEAAMKQQKSESARFCPTQLDTLFFVGNV